MVSIVIPPGIVPTEEAIELIDDGTAVFRPSMASGLTQRQQFAPPRWRVTQRWQGLRAADLARMMAVTHALRGRFYTLRAVVGNAPRGSMPTVELLANGDFSNGTTSWVAAAEATIAVNDQVLRVKRTSTVSGYNAYATAAAFSVTQYAAYLFRIAVTATKGIVNPAPTHGSDCWSLNTAGWESGSEVSLRAALFQSSTTSTAVYADNVDPVSLGQTQAGDYYDVSWATVARCLLVDNGANSLLYSDQIDNAIWTKLGCTVAANAAADPFGGTTAETMTEGSGGTYHYVTQSASRASAAATACAWGFFKSTTGDRIVTLWVGADGGSNGSSARFDLLYGYGASAITNTGAATNARAFSYSVGNGWYFCAVVSRLPASTSLQGVAYITDELGSYTYSGNGASAISVSRFGAALTPFPPYAPETVASARATGAPQTGTTLRVKGGPANGAGLLLPGDYFTVNGELKRVTGALDTDGAGRGTLHFEPELFTSPADNAAVVINKPMGKFILAEQPRWTNTFGKYADLELTFESIYEP